MEMNVQHLGPRMDAVKMYPAGYPLVNLQKTNGKITMLLMGKSTINDPFSIANC